MKLKERNGIFYPAKMKLRSWIVAGPPGSGKSFLIEKIGGWPGEVGIDISIKRWWAVEPLTHRPREIHFALPFKGIEERYSVYDKKWQGVKDLPEVEFERIRIPQKKKFILAPNWRARFVFDFILPPPGWLHGIRKERLSSSDVRLVDMGLTPQWVAWQVHVHWLVARHFHQSGLQVFLRPFNTARPFSFPILEKVLSKKVKPSKKKLSPSLNWSKLGNVLLWIGETAPKDWQKGGEKKKT